MQGVVSLDSGVVEELIDPVNLSGDDTGGRADLLLDSSRGDPA